MNKETLRGKDQQDLRNMMIFNKQEDSWKAAWRSLDNLKSA
jgi:hypothetical protein